MGFSSSQFVYSFCFVLVVFWVFFFSFVCGMNLLFGDVILLALLSLYFWSVGFIGYYDMTARLDLGGI